MPEVGLTVKILWATKRACLLYTTTPAGLAPHDLLLVTLLTVVPALLARLSARLI